MPRADLRRGLRGVPRCPGGFTFLGLMFLIALMALMATAAATTWAFTSQREKEADLLFVGREYREALTRYAAAHARERQSYPTELKQLLGGGDSLVPVRYLRKLYFDPMTGSPDWGLVRTREGGITGVYSLSERVPVRRAAPYEDLGIAFDKAKSYRDWVFRATVRAPTTNAPQAPAKGAVPGWDYARDGEPPPTWENAPPAPEVVPEPE